MNEGLQSPAAAAALERGDQPDPPASEPRMYRAVWLSRASTASIKKASSNHR